MVKDPASYVRDFYLILVVYFNGEKIAESLW